MVRSSATTHAVDDAMPSFNSDRIGPRRKEAGAAAFFWLSTFYVVYCGRPTDLIPVLSAIPLAKVTAAMAALALFASVGKTPRKFKHLPIEGWYLFAILALLFLSGILSPVWRGGAISSTLDFAKVALAWVLTYLLVTSFQRLRRVIFIQSAAVAIVAVAALLKGHSVDRLNGVIGGYYSNPNDMAMSVVLALPFCLAFLLTERNRFVKVLWFFGILAMLSVLLLTASRAGFIDLVFTGSACVWYFGVKGKRKSLVVGAIVITSLLFLVAGRTLEVRLAGIFDEGDSAEQDTARLSYLERKMLMERAFDAVERYPILGIGEGNFEEYGGLWREVHVAYLQLAVEGGIPVLILYMLFLRRGFLNLKWLSKQQSVDAETVLFIGALTSSLIGFVVGACFAPAAYQFFPYFTVCYTSVLVASVRERSAELAPATSALTRVFMADGVAGRRPGALSGSF